MPVSSAPGPLAPRITAIATTRISALTGPDAPGNQKSVDICGTDLGIMTEHNGRVYFAFGDTFGYDGDVCRGVGGPNWRSNTFAWTDNPQPKYGMALTDWLCGPNGTAIAVIDGAHQDPVAGQPTERTKIPTAMTTVADTLYLHYMSVHDFAAKGGVWDCNYTSWVSSTDSGQTWTESAQQFSGPTSNFIELALTSAVSVDNPDGAYVYGFGTPSGRFGSAQLGRAPVGSVTDPTTWQYVHAVAPDGSAATWSDNPADAITVVPGPVGEASVLWNPALGRWMFTYLNEDAAALQLREAEHLWGPWTAPHTLATGADYPQLYGAFMTPALLADGGRTVFFVMSQYGPYNTFLMQAELTIAK